jgi:hypothetical protein
VIIWKAEILDLFIKDTVYTIFAFCGKANEAEVLMVPCLIKPKILAKAEAVGSFQSDAKVANVG